MPKTKSKRKRRAAVQTAPIAHKPPASKRRPRGGPPARPPTSGDQERYGAPPLLPHESEARYNQIARWLKPSFGGYQSRFEHHLEKEIVDSIWKRQRWEYAETGSTNRLARQLMEAPQTAPSDFATLLSGLPIAQLSNLPAPGDTSAKLESPPALRALAVVKNQPTRALLQKRLDVENKRFTASNDLLVLLRERRALLSAMDHHNGLAQVLIPTSPYELDAQKITPKQRRDEQLTRRSKNRMIYAERSRGWTAEGVALLGADLFLRGESPWAFANLYLDIEEYLPVEGPGDALIIFEIAKETWRIRRLNEASHQIVLMSFEAKARKYLAPDILLPLNETGATEDRALLLVRELQAARSSPNLVLAEALQEIAPILDNLDHEIDRAYARRLDNIRLLTRLRGKELLTEHNIIRGAGYRNLGDHESLK